MYGRAARQWRDLPRATPGNGRVDRDAPRPVESVARGEERPPWGDLRHRARLLRMPDARDRAAAAPSRADRRRGRNDRRGGADLDDARLWAVARLARPASGEPAQPV